MHEYHTPLVINKSSKGVEENVGERTEDTTRKENGDESIENRNREDMSGGGTDWIKFIGFGEQAYDEDIFRDEEIVEEHVKDVVEENVQETVEEQVQQQEDFIE